MRSLFNLKRTHEIWPFPPLLVCLLVCLFVCPLSTFAQARPESSTPPKPASASLPFSLHDGETVVFYGDSITAQRLYTRFVEDFVLTRYPQLHIKFINAGVPGDQVTGGYAGKMSERVERDVKPFNPSMITVMLGMNDGQYGTESPGIDAAFKQGYVELIEALHRAAPNAELTLIRPSPYDEITHGTDFPGYSRVIDDLANDVTTIESKESKSSKHPSLLTDFHQPFIDALKRAQAQSPQLAKMILVDRIHPGEVGHWIMAAQLMQCWHVDPIVTSVTLDAAKLRPIESQRTTVTDLAQSARGLHWTQTDQALPLPFDFNNALIALALKVSDIAKLDRQVLRVKALASGTYKLQIDNKPVGVFSAQTLSRGVNLALLKTPMVDQAHDVDSLEYQRTELDQARFILSANLPAAGIQPDANTRIAEDKLTQAQEQLAVEIRKRLEPKPHRYELQRE